MEFAEHKKVIFFCLLAGSFRACVIAFFIWRKSCNLFPHTNAEGFIFVQYSLLEKGAVKEDSPSISERSILISKFFRWYTWAVH